MENDDTVGSVSSDDSCSTSTTFSSDLTEDATSPSSSSSSSSSSCSPENSSNGPLYELSSLMAQLPIKRGISKYFDGKSQSFTCLSNVRCLEDLPKKEISCRKKMKPCMSYGGGLNKTIRKKGSRGGSCPSLLPREATFAFFVSNKLPPTTLRKK